MQLLQHENEFYELTTLLHHYLFLPNKSFISFTIVYLAAVSRNTPHLMSYQV